MEKIFNKLVRDKIPEIILKNGGKPEVKILDDLAYLENLNKKLLEECNEVVNAKNNEEELEELADVLEVIHSLIKALDISFDKVEKIRLEKKEKRGGFDSKLFLKKTTIVEKLK